MSKAYGLFREHEHRPAPTIQIGAKGAVTVLCHVPPRTVPSALRNITTQITHEVREIRGDNATVRVTFAYDSRNGKARYKLPS